MATATPKRDQAGTVLCAYLGGSGQDLELKSFALTHRYLIRSPRYVFTDRKLSKITFTTSIDAFNDMTARLERRYGPASHTLRGYTVIRGHIRLPRVEEIWTRPHGTIQIVDPSTTAPTELTVQVASR